MKRRGKQLGNIKKEKKIKVLDEMTLDDVLDTKPNIQLTNQTVGHSVIHSTRQIN